MERKPELFNQTGTEISKKELDFVQNPATNGLEDYYAGLRAILEDVSIEVSPKLHHVETEIRNQYEAKMSALGISERRSPKVYYVPVERMPELSPFLGERSSQCGGMVPALEDAAIIVVYPDGSDLFLAKRLSHELSHAYGYHTLRHDLLERVEDGGLRGNIGRKRLGAMHRTPQREYHGELIEEGSAERNAMDEFSRMKHEFPQDYEKYIDQRSRWLEENKETVDPSYANYIDEGFYTSEEGYGTGYMVNGYVFAVKLVSKLIYLHPELADLIEEMRLKGNYRPFAETIEKHFGKGVFRILMSSAIDRKSVESLSELLDTPPTPGNKGKRDELFTEILKDKPHDIDILKRRDIIGGKQ